eukprot:491923-Amphidinium_carterae.1
MAVGVKKATVYLNDACSSKIDYKHMKSMLNLDIMFEQSTSLLLHRQRSGCSQCRAGVIAPLILFATTHRMQPGW